MDVRGYHGDIAHGRRTDIARRSHGDRTDMVRISYKPPIQTNLRRLQAALKRLHNARISQTKHTQPITRSHGPRRDLDHSSWPPSRRMAPLCTRYVLRRHRSRMYGDITGISLARASVWMSHGCRTYKSATSVARQTVLQTFAITAPYGSLQLTQ